MILKMQWWEADSQNIINLEVMDSTVFENDIDIVNFNFLKVLELLIFCYSQIHWEIIAKKIKKEIYIRNKFLLSLRNEKINFWLDRLYFECESWEFNENPYSNWWFVDIKVGNIDSNCLYLDENKYFSFECKRLNWTSGKNVNEYEKNGIHRYVNWKYAQKMNTVWMIWFVQWFKKWTWFDELIIEFKSKIPTFTEFKISHHKYSYISEHTRIKKLWNVRIHHLLFDFT